MCLLGVFSPGMGLLFLEYVTRGVISSSGSLLGVFCLFISVLVIYGATLFFACVNLTVISFRFSAGDLRRCVTCPEF